MALNNFHNEHYKLHLNRKPLCLSFDFSLPLEIRISFVLSYIQHRTVYYRRIVFPSAFPPSQAAGIRPPAEWSEFHLELCPPYRLALIRTGYPWEPLGRVHRSRGRARLSLPAGYPNDCIVPVTRSSCSFFVFYPHGCSSFA